MSSSVQMANVLPADGYVMVIMIAVIQAMKKKIAVRHFNKLSRNFIHPHSHQRIPFLEFKSVDMKNLRLFDTVGKLGSF